MSIPKILLASHCEKCGTTGQCELKVKESWDQAYDTTVDYATLHLVCGPCGYHHEIHTFTTYGD